MSVLGLRRIKESWFTNYIANVGEFDKTSQSEMQNVYNQYGFEIEPTTFTLEGITATLLGLTTTFAYIESEFLPNTTKWVGKVFLNGAEMYVAPDSNIFTDIIRQFTITATPNSTVDEWLLANTEAVIEKDYLIKSSTLTAIADAIRSKDGTTEAILTEEMATKIGAIELPIPKEISTEAEMTALLSTEAVGSVYKYIGTTGVYENGTLYIIEEDGA